ncbi:MAG TPA: hypothetical protein VGP36_24955 [Mycobacteriales bacterium]|nr:hypothetical protein [Mycobacteriales bacterium]
MAPGHEPPLVDPGEARRAQLTAAGLAVLAGLVLGLGAIAGRTGVVATVALAQAALVPAWVLGARRPGRIGGMVLGVAAAGAADAALLIRDRTSPAVLLGVLGLAVPVLLAHQLTRGVVRVRVTESLAGVAVLVAAEVGLSTLVALDRADLGNRLTGVVVLAAGAALAVARLTDAVAPVPRIADGLPYGLLAVVLAAVAGAAVGVVTATGPLSTTEGAGVGALVGAVAALVSVGTGFVAVMLPEPRRALALAAVSVLVPLALVAPVGYLTVLSVAG